MESHLAKKLEELKSLNNLINKKLERITELGKIY